MPTATASNNAVERTVAVPQSLAGSDATHASLWADAQGTTFLQWVALTNNPDPLALDERYEIAIGALVLNQETDDTANVTYAALEMAKRKLRGAISGGIWVLFHAGAPGDDGMDNQMIDLGFLEIPEARWTVA